MVCLDTDIIIDFLKKDKLAYAKIIELKKSNVKITTTTINAFELFKGLPDLSEQSRYDAAEIFLNNIKVFKFTLSSAKKAAEIFNYLMSKGEIIELPDIMIASIAMENNEFQTSVNIFMSNLTNSINTKLSETSTILWVIAAILLIAVVSAILLRKQRKMPSKREK